MARRPDLCAPIGIFVLAAIPTIPGGRAIPNLPITNDPQPEADLQVWLSGHRASIDDSLRGLLPARAGGAPAVHDAMEQALLSAGKRIRPIVMLGIAEIYRTAPRRILPSACAIEMVHASSLILDDLPCMDGALMRRGMPACHVAHGESMAILAAVALLNRAFAILAGEDATDAMRDRLRNIVVRRAAEAIGTDGVIGGQAADLALSGGRGGEAGTSTADLQTLEGIHHRKTGSLFIAAAEIAARLSGATKTEIDLLCAYAKNLGLAFQITDDLIDAVGDAASAGKPVRMDSDRITFVDLCGVDGARTLARELADAAVEALAPFGRRALWLERLARHIAVRDR